MPRVARDIASIPRAWKWGERALIWLVFAAHGGFPVPEVNEPHYLTKAKAFWNPDWIPGDFFLESPSAHYVFYLTCGWWTVLLPLSLVAWLGRIVTWGLLAGAWHRLSAAVVPVWGCGVLTATLFAAMNERYHMAGEWVVGGFEAKGIAYALSLFGLSQILRRHWDRAWLPLGVATAFHALVGGWNLIAAAIAWLAVGRARDAQIRTMAPSLALGSLVALTGIVPLVRLTWGVDAETLGRANLVYMERLPHHLDLLKFPPDFIARHLLLLAGWLFLCSADSKALRRGRLKWIIAGAIAIAVAGTAITLGTLRHKELAAALLRYYWFRLSDAYLPLGVALLAASVAYRASRAEWVWLLWFLAAWQLVSVAGRPWTPVPQADKPGKVISYDDWRDICRWVRENTPRDARFLTPRSCQTFKWRAERSEVVTWKDIPQDPRGLVEWRNRMERVFGNTGYADEPFFSNPAGLDAQRLRALARDYGATFVVGKASPYCELPVLYANGSYAVYDPTGGPAAESAAVHDESQ